MGVALVLVQSSGTVPVRSELLKITCNIGAISACSSLYRRCFSSSELAALFGWRFRRSLLIPSLGIQINVVHGAVRTFVPINLTVCVVTFLRLTQLAELQGWFDTENWLELSIQYRRLYMVICVQEAISPQWGYTLGVLSAGFKEAVKPFGWVLSRTRLLCGCGAGTGVIKSKESYICVIGSLEAASLAFTLWLALRKSLRSFCCLLRFCFWYRLSLRLMYLLISWVIKGRDFLLP